MEALKYCRIWFMYLLLMSSAIPSLEKFSAHPMYGTVQSSSSFRNKTSCHSLFSVFTSQSAEYDAKGVGVSKEHVLLNW